jgi:hypothetical protein
MVPEQLGIVACVEDLVALSAAVVEALGFSRDAEKIAEPSPG